MLLFASVQAEELVVQRRTMKDMGIFSSEIPIHWNVAGDLLELCGGASPGHMLSVCMCFVVPGQEGVDPFSPCLAESAKQASDAKSSYEKVLHLCVKAGLNALEYATKTL